MKDNNKDNENWEAAFGIFLALVVILSILAIVSTLDYKDQRQVECLRQGQNYNQLSDSCEGEV